LLKKNNNLKIRLNKHGSIKCREYYTAISSSEYYLVDDFGKRLFAFIALGKYDETLSALMSLYNCDSVICWEPEFVKILPIETQFVFPETTGTLSMSRYPDYKKDEILYLMKDKIIDAYKRQIIDCPPDLDTMFSVNFRVRIIGECKQTH
jgi:cellulose biosynthesis protein BcsQ